MRWLRYGWILFRCLLGLTLISGALFGFMPTARVLLGVRGGVVDLGSILLLVVVMFVLGVLCFTPDLVRMASMPFRSFFYDIFYPRNRYHSPHPDYTLARQYRKQLRHSEALGCYQQILDDYPKEEAAYEEAIAFALECGEVKIARKWSRGRSDGAEVEGARPKSMEPRCFILVRVQRTAYNGRLNEVYDLYVPSLL